jgi:hypothetical protein
MASTALRRPLAVRGGPPGVIAVVLIVLARGRLGYGWLAEA